MDAVRFLNAPVREGSTVLRVYNDGLTGFLYDRKNEAAIRRSRAALLHGIGRSVYDDAKSMRLLASGMLLLFGLPQDDSLAVEVVVGAPLSEAERAHGPWQDAGPAWIDLPGGTLCLHSYNSLPMGENDGPTDSPGASLKVPAGRYEARWYRKHLRALGESRDELFEAAGVDAETLVTDVLVLTPMAPDAPPPSPHNVLFGDCIDFDDPALRPRRVVDGVWSGRVGDAPAPGTIAIDLTEDDADALGLRCGDRLIVTAGDVELPVFYFGERHVGANWGLAYGRADNGGLPGDVVAEGHLGGGRLDWSAFYERRLELRARPGSEGHAFFELPVRTPVTARVAAEPYVALPPPATFSKGVAAGCVVGSTGHGLLLSIDDKVFRRLRVGDDERIEIEAGGHRFIAAQMRRPDMRTLRNGPPTDPTGSRPVWNFIGYVAAKGQSLLGLQVESVVRRLPEEAQAPYLLPVLPVGMLVTVRKAAAVAEPA